MERIIWGLVLLMSLIVSAQAASIQSISDNGPLGKYEKLEISYDLGKSYANPFDPAQIDVTVDFKSPSGKTRSVKGFIYQDYDRQGDFDHQTFWGTNNLTIQVDGKPTEVDNTVAKAKGSYEAKIPAGVHDISVDSTGQDWVQVASYSIGNYVGALSGKGKVLGHVQSRGFTYANPKPVKVAKAVLKLDGLSTDGLWKVEWWDTEKGIITGIGKLKVTNNGASLPVPPVVTDLAFKLIYAGK